MRRCFRLAIATPATPLMLILRFSFMSLALLMFSLFITMPLDDGWCWCRLFSPLAAFRLSLMLSLLPPLIDAFLFIFHISADADDDITPVTLLITPPLLWCHARPPLLISRRHWLLLYADAGCRHAADEPHFLRHCCHAIDFAFIIYAITPFRRQPGWCRLFRQIRIDAIRFSMLTLPLRHAFLIISLSPLITLSLDADFAMPLMLSPPLLAAWYFRWHCRRDDDWCRLCLLLLTYWCHELRGWYYAAITLLLIWLFLFALSFRCHAFFHAILSLLFSPRSWLAYIRLLLAAAAIDTRHADTCRHYWCIIEPLMMTFSLLSPCFTIFITDMLRYDDVVCRHATPLLLPYAAYVDLPIRWAAADFDSWLIRSWLPLWHERHYFRWCRIRHCCCWLFYLRWCRHMLLYAITRWYTRCRRTPPDTLLRWCRESHLRCRHCHFAAITPLRCLPRLLRRHYITDDIRHFIEYI